MKSEKNCADFLNIQSMKEKRDVLSRITGGDAFCSRRAIVALCEICERKWETASHCRWTIGNCSYSSVSYV